MGRPYHLVHAVAALCSALLLGLAPGASSRAADADEIAQLRRQLDALRAENRALGERLSRETELLERRLRELETTKAAQEDAVRSIIRDSIATSGSRINESAALGGTLEATFGRRTDFSGERKASVGLGSVDFEFEVQTNEWALGVVKLEYVDGASGASSAGGASQANVDRINLDTAYLRLGDQRRFPPHLTIGRMVLPFGISTGRPVADVLSTNSPLTVEAFETRRNAIALNLAFPTPPLRPPVPPVAAPAVAPVALQPLIGTLTRSLGYEPPPTRPKPPSPVLLPVPTAPFDAGVYVYEGRTSGGLRKHVGGTLGFSAHGNCGRRYEELGGVGVCPWAAQVDFGYNPSVFNSRFLETEYGEFLNRIGRVPGLSASVKASLGPFAVVGEWNGATQRSRFVDDAGDPIAIKPSAWQLSLGYQLDWNPWVQEIGAQGTYLAIGYSRTRDLSGATRVIDGVRSRVGALPETRLLLTAGEWVLDGVRVVLEYERDWDYAVVRGGTGKVAHGLFMNLTHTW